jgi:hypothetical protein
MRIECFYKEKHVMTLDPSCSLGAVAKQSCTVAVVLFVLSSCALESFSQAAPITLTFDAVVGPPRQGVEGRIPPDWGISLQQGDIISGKFTFEPVDAGSGVSETRIVQPFDFSIQIKSRTLTTSQYEVQVLNDSISDDAPDPADVIRVGCSYFGGGSACIPATVSPNDPIEWAFGIAMSGDSTVLDGADLPANPSVWQQMPAEILISLRDRNAGQFYGLLAAVESIRFVPEPISLSFVVVGISFLFFVRAPGCARK